MSNICGIRFQDKISDWKDAIRQVAQPLLEKGCIQESYIDAMIQNVIENGNYIIIMPGFAMPHARPEFGALGNGMSVLKVKEPVMFPGDQEVTVLVSFSGVNPEEHLEMISKLTDVLMDDELVDKLFSASTESEVLEVIA
ncbi:MAG: PTS sugar transporter subunit IIA [Lachnospiraceae bacterium]|nr:PTS sugar transporter subunit IIA [Lachnospiraceae bacterium]